MIYFHKNSKIEKFKDVPLSWQCMNENRQIMLVIWPVMNALPFETNQDFLAQSSQKWKLNKHNKNCEIIEKNRNPGISKTKKYGSDFF